MIGPLLSSPLQGTPYVISTRMTHCVEQTIGSSAYLYDSDTFEIPKPSPSNSDRINGMQFEGIAIPPYCLVSSAYIQFTSRSTDSGTVITKIRATTDRNLHVLADASYSVSSRPLTTQVGAEFLQGPVPRNLELVEV